VITGFTNGRRGYASSIAAQVGSVLEVDDLFSTIVGRRGADHIGDLPSQLGKSAAGSGLLNPLNIGERYSNFSPYC
jgi:hypothetical protein